MNLLGIMAVEQGQLDLRGSYMGRQSLQIASPVAASRRSQGGPRLRPAIAPFLAGHSTLGRQS